MSPALRYAFGMKTLSLALLVAAAACSAASAEPVIHEGRSGGACSDGTGFEGRTLVLWVTDKTNPDEAPCLARLAYARCENEGTDENVPSGTALRYFSGAGIVAQLSVEPTGGVSVELRYAGTLGMRSGVSYLGTFPYQRAVYQGIGVDQASAYDIEARTHRAIGNVFLIPAENLTPRARALCP
jgi:hypothetical protein